MLTFNNSVCLGTVSNTATLTTASVSFYIYPTNITTKQYVMQIGYFVIYTKTLPQYGGFYIYIQNSKLYFSAPQNADDTVGGIWSCAISNTTHQYCTITFNFNGSTTDPVMYINGVSKTVTEEQTPTGIAAHAASGLWIGGDSSNNSPLLNANVDEVSLHNVILTAAQVAVLHGARVKRTPLQYSSCINYWALDELGDGVDIGTYSQLNPNADILATWSTATPHWSKVNTVSGVGITANDGDDNEEEQFDYTTATIPTDRPYIIAIFLYAQGSYSTGGALSGRINMNGWQTQYGFGFTTTEALHVIGYWAPSLTGWTQTHLNAIQSGLQVGTMDKDYSVFVRWAPINVWFVKGYLNDMKGTSHLRTWTVLGKANNYFSYPQ